MHRYIAPFVAIAVALAIAFAFIYNCDFVLQHLLSDAIVCVCLQLRFGLAEMLSNENYIRIVLQANIPLTW